jgi:Recombinase/Resolvase, N terminal domain
MQYVPSGVYFARVRHKGKLFRQSLETDVFTTAKLRLPDKLKELRKPKAEVGTFKDGRLNYETETQNDYTLAPLSETYRLRCVEYLLKTWPGVDKLRVYTIKEADCQHWAARYAAHYSPTVFNNTVNTLRRILTLICSIFCIEASRLARNGRDWHHLIDFCALVNTLVIDGDGVYDPRLINDRLLLGLKGTMSEYELSLLRQRGLAARDAKARRGELRFALPPGYCWDELGRIEIDPDERVSEAIRLLFRKFQERGSAHQVFLWARQASVKLQVLRQSPIGSGIEWRQPAYHTVAQVLKHPMYAGAYVFSRTTQRTQVIDGRARKSMGHHKPMEAWNVLIREHHPGYITWEQFEANQKMLSENAHMQKRTARKSARGGRALLTGLVRCGRCGRMMRVFYGMRGPAMHTVSMSPPTTSHPNAKSMRDQSHLKAS